ncbi:MAG TPA: MopE-related protein [Chitinophagaceae bacterium]|nr:MopE-related protein [Chitinophagaceae bacterium]
MKTRVLFFMLQLLGSLTIKAQLLADDYRTISSGNWDNVSIWERYTGTSWVPATSVPSSSNMGIDIRSGHVVQTNNFTGTIDDVEIHAGAVLTINSPLNLNDNTAFYGDDIIVWQSGTLNVEANISGSGRIEVHGVMNWGDCNINVSIFVDGNGGVLNLIGAHNRVFGDGITHKTLDIGGFGFSSGNMNLGGGVLEFIYSTWDISGIVRGNSFHNTVVTQSGNIFQNSGILISENGVFINSDEPEITNTFEVQLSNSGTIAGVGRIISKKYIAISGKISPGLSPGILNISAVGEGWLSLSYPEYYFPEFNIELIDASGPGIGHDQFTTDNQIVLSGHLNVSEISTIPSGDYSILKAEGGISGRFSTTNLPPCIMAIYTPTEVILRKGSPTDTYYIDADQDGYGTGQSVVQCTRPANGYFENELISISGDCNDSDHNINPSAPEVCNGIDDDCDGLVDGNDPSAFLALWYPDLDGDGFGDNSGIPIASCVGPSGFVDNNNDCDDSKAEISPNGYEICNGLDDNCDGLIDEADPSVLLEYWFPDNDKDGFGDMHAEPITSCTRPDGYVNYWAGGDCDDNNAAVHWGAIELCDGIDNDCDGQIDEDFDADSDTYTTCGDITNKRTNGLPGGKDCDDTNHNLTGVEICDGLDNDCDGLIDEDLEIKTYYLDNDGDGYGVVEFTITSCIRPFGYALWSGDCNDYDPYTHPGGEFGCDILRRFYRDKDGDGYGVEEDNINSYMQQPPSGYASRPGDCNDNHAGISPGIVWCKDTDNDGYGEGTILIQCEQPEGFKAAACLIATQGDCDDGNAAVHPGATEICGNGIDDDCNESTSDACPITDADNDGDPDVTDCNDNNPNIHHGATEICGNGVDDDCNESTSDVCPVTDTDNDGDPDASDCDDNNPAIHHGAIEVCNGIDDDCNGLVDDNIILVATISPAGIQNICPGTTLTLFASPSTSGATFQWFKNNKIIDNQTASILAVSSSGDYKVKITQGNCSAISPITTVTLISPQATIKISGKNSNPCSAPVQLMANNVQGSYQWYKDGALQSSNGSSFTATSAGEYWVVIIKNGCSSESNHITLSCPSVKAKSTETTYEIASTQNDLKVQPNPATHFLDAQWKTTNRSQNTIRIFNAEGRVVKTITIKGGVNNQRISLEGLAKGIYMLVLKTGSDQQASKFVIQ